MLMKGLTGFVQRNVMKFNRMSVSYICTINDTAKVSKYKELRTDVRNSSSSQKEHAAI